MFEESSTASSPLLWAVDDEPDSRKGEHADGECDDGRIEGIRDIIHGVAIPQHGINLAIAPQDTRQVTFTADDPGVYWVYCTYFCSALHLEMRSRMIVEPSD